MNQQRKNSLKGATFIVSAMFLFSLMDTVIKYLSTEYSAIQIIFFRSLFSFIPLSFYLMRSHTFAVLKTKKVHLHITRAFIGIAAYAAFVFAVARIPLANVYAIEFACPIFMTILSQVILKEKVTLHHWIAIGLGFVGVLVIIEPGSDLFNMASVIALCGSFLFALMSVQIRQFSHVETQEAIVFYFVLVCTLVTGIFVIFDWKTPSGNELFLLILIGLFGGTAQIFLAKAFSMASVSLLAPLEYITIIWAVLFGWLFFHEIPTLMVYIGAAIVIASGLYITYKGQGHS
jgi:drug/metabolite transporter (DMT)-like permease